MRCLQGKERKYDKRFPECHDRRALRILFAATAQAADTCDASALQGQYAFKVQGENVGVLDSGGVVHPFASPLKVTAVGQFTFDGSSTFTRTDFNVSNGAPTITATTPLTSNGFRTGQTGTYTVDADCTGKILLEVPGGREIHIAIAVVENGQGVYGVVEAAVPQACQPRRAERLVVMLDAISVGQYPAGTLNTEPTSPVRKSYNFAVLPNRAREDTS